jgi:hypothetical protein
VSVHLVGNAIAGCPLKRSRVAWASVLVVLGGCAQIAGLQDRTLEDAGSTRTDGGLDDAPGRDVAEAQAPPADADADVVVVAEAGRAPADAPTTDAPIVGPDAPLADVGDAIADSHAGADVADTAAAAPTWTLVAPAVTSNTLYAVSGGGPDDVWIVGSGVVLQWAGSGWAADNALGPGGDWRGVWWVAAVDIWVVSTTGGGEYFRGTYLPVSGTVSLSSVWAQGSMSNAVVYAGSTMGVVTVGGNLWKPVTGTTGIVLAMGGTGPLDVWSAGDGVYRTGSGFGWVGEDLEQQFAAISTAGLGTAFAVGSALNGNNVEVISDPAGTGSPSLMQLTLGTYSFNAVWAYSDHDVWAVGDMGAMVHFDGSSWTPAPTVTGVALRGVWGSSASDVWAVGDQGVILHYH